MDTLIAKLESITANSIQIMKDSVNNLVDKKSLDPKKAEEIVYLLTEMPSEILKIYNKIFPILNSKDSSKEEIANALTDLLLCCQRIDYLLHASTDFNLGKMSWSDAVDKLYEK